MSEDANTLEGLDEAADDLGVRREFLASLYVAGGNLDSIVIGCMHLLRRTRSVDPERQIRHELHALRTETSATERAGRSMWAFGARAGPAMVAVALNLEMAVLAPVNEG